MYKRLITTILLIFTLGCSSVPIQVQNPFVVPETEDIIQHPNLPKGIKPFMKDRLETLVYTDEQGNTRDITGFEFDDYILFSLWLQDQERYREEQEQVICFYRKELKESRCKKYEVIETP